MDNPAMTAPSSQCLDQQILDESQIHLQSRSSNDEANRYVSKIQIVSKNEQGWRRVVRNFSPSWFSVTMGTGVSAQILFYFPWQADWLYYISIIFFVLNAILWFSALTISILRYTIWPEIWPVMIEDTINSLFLATIPIGFATLVSMWTFICVPLWGEWAIYLAWGGWMLDSVVAVAVTVTMGYLLMSAEDSRTLDTITAVQLLPISATIVAAGTGSQIASALPNPQQALATIITSYVLWGMAIPMSMTVLAMYYQRLALHKIPPREVIVSVFLPLGPLGTGGHAILRLGKQARMIFPETNTIDPIAGQVAYVVGVLVALTFWSWALLWLCFALGTLCKTALRTGVPFNMGWWGFTFPLGVLSIATIDIGRSIPSLFFRVLGTIFGTCVLLLWIVIACGTVKGACSGELFQAPCLRRLPAHQQIPEIKHSDKEKLESTAELAK